MRSAIRRAATGLALGMGVLAHASAMDTVAAQPVLASPPAVDTLPPALSARVDEIVRSTVADNELPSVSIAILRDGEPVLERAWGAQARLSPPTPASPGLRYHIGSVSKQFTAAALLLLAEDGKLSLDDRVARWLPELPHAADITLRQLLNMTAGYTDDWPQDYVMAPMTRDAAPIDVARQWTAKPLDFAPGAGRLYSNVDFTVAGLVAERTSGRPLFELLRTRIFEPLGMRSVVDVDAEGGCCDATREAQGLERHGLGPLRESPKEGRGWLYAMGSLSMTAHDLALWDRAMLHRALLKPASWEAMWSDTLTSAGRATGYGLGIGSRMVDGRRRLSHDGAVSGFLAYNRVYPDDGLAIVVQTNQSIGADSALPRIAEGISRLLLAERVADAGRAPLALAQKLYAQAQAGSVDDALLSPAYRAWLTPDKRADFASSLSKLGPTSAWREVFHDRRGSMDNREYHVEAGGLSLDVTLRVLDDGLVEEFQVQREN